MRPRVRRIATVLHHPLLALAGLWIAAICVVNPIGDFPLNDDWSYAQPVRSLVEEGRIHFCGWTSMPLVSQVLWGALFCIPAGFSFTALRFSTLTLAFVGGASTYGLLRELRSSRSLAFLGAASLLFNPLFFLQSFSFMTDAPFVGMATLSLYLYVRALRRDSAANFAAATVVAILATLIRQLGLALPMAAAIGLVFRHGLGRKSLLAGTLAVVSCVIALFAFEHWLETVHGLPAVYRIKEAELHERLRMGWRPLCDQVARHGMVALVYLGLSLAPVLIAELRLPRRRGSAGLLCAAGTGFVWFCWSRLDWQPMPLSGNVLHNAGLGATLLTDTHFYQQSNVPIIPSSVWYVVTMIGFVLAFVLVVFILRNAWSALRPDPSAEAENRWRVPFVFAASGLYFGPLAVAGYFDRYLLFLIPLLMILVRRGRDAKLAVDLVSADRMFESSLKSARSLAIGAVAALALFAVVGTHDYLAWNRARWKALDELTLYRGVGPERIDGGFEFNGWHNYDPQYVKRPGKVEWWWVVDDEYRIAFGPTPGYRTEATFSYRRWIPFRRDRIHILQRLPEPLALASASSSAPSSAPSSASK
jgi:4-amino-4-deoxy-L-arabinose transferase-like glycosyltransferase